MDATPPTRHTEIDPLLRLAAADVDRGLLTWTLSLAPRERLRVATRARKALGKFRRDAPARG